MSIYTSAVKYDPEWEVWPPDEVEAVTVSSTFCKKLSEFHVGLKFVNVTPTYRDPDTGAQMQCKTQKFVIKGGGKNKIPAISADDLARIITCFAQEQCDDLGKGEVSYQCHFTGSSDEHGGDFYKRGSFRLQPQEDEEEPEARPEPAPPVGAAIALGRPGLPGRRFLGEPGTPVPSPLESEAISAIRLSFDNGQRLFNEHQSFLEQVKTTVAGIMQSVSDSWKDVVNSQNTVIDKLVQENEHQRKEISAANNRLIKMTEQYASQYEGEHKIMQYAMDMFLEGMKAQWGSLSRDMSWERQIMYQQFDALAQEQHRGNRGQWLKELSPIFGAIVSQVIERIGGDPSSLIQQLDGPEDDPDPGEPAARPSPPKRPPGRTVLGVPPGVDPAQHLQQHPIASTLQLFGSMVLSEDDKATSLQQILGPEKYKLLTEATQAKDDAEARALGIRFMTSLTMDTSLRPKMEELLNEQQRELLGDIHKQLFGSGGFQKPETISRKSSIDSKASIAELRTMAKQKYGLTFPATTKKKEIIAAIEEATKKAS